MKSSEEEARDLHLPKNTHRIHVGLTIVELALKVNSLGDQPAICIPPCDGGNNRTPLLWKDQPNDGSSPRDLRVIFIPARGSPPGFARPRLR